MLMALHQTHQQALSSTSKHQQTTKQEVWCNYRTGFFFGETLQKKGAKPQNIQLAPPQLRSKIPATQQKQQTKQP